MKSLPNNTQKQARPPHRKLSANDRALMKAAQKFIDAHAKLFELLAAER